jgi:GT2 family glycosyltransferase
MDRGEAEQLLEERARHRAARDFEAADRVRDQLLEAGWQVVDAAGGSRLEPVEVAPPPRDATLLTLVHGWPDDVRRWLRSIQAHPPDLDWEVVIVDNSGDADVGAQVAALAGERVRAHTIQPAVGWSDAANEGLELAAGDLIVLFDPGTEVSGDLGPLFQALADDGVAVAGPFAVTATHSLHHIESTGAGATPHAIEGYCMAFRKADAQAAGGFDRKFRFYRIADFELSFRMRAQGNRRAKQVAVSVEKHAHRLWEATEPEERDRLSKKNFYRFLDLWREREDLIAE